MREKSNKDDPPHGWENEAKALQAGVDGLRLLADRLAAALRGQYDRERALAEYDWLHEQWKDDDA